MPFVVAAVADDDFVFGATLERMPLAVDFFAGEGAAAAVGEAAIGKVESNLGEVAVGVVSARCSLSVCVGV